MHHHHRPATRPRPTSERAAFVVTAVLFALVLVPIAALVLGATVRLFRVVAGL